MRDMESATREHTQRVFQETDKLRKQLVQKESYIQRRSRQLNELVAQTDMERRKLEEERKKVWMHPHMSSHFRKLLNSNHSLAGYEMISDTCLSFLFLCRMLTKMIPSTWLELSNKKLMNVL